jgi:hypothetical protein
MGHKADTFPGLSARRLCAITGVLPQTRDTWADRQLLDRKGLYNQLDAIEQIVLAQLLKDLPKGDVQIAWPQVREDLHRQVPGGLASVIWDPKPRLASLANTEAEIVELVRHGREVFVVPVADLIDQTRQSYQTEVAAWKSKSARRVKDPRAQRQVRRSP